MKLAVSWQITFAAVAVLSGFRLVAARDALGWLLLVMTAVSLVISLRPSSGGTDAGDSDGRQT